MRTGQAVVVDHQTGGMGPTTLGRTTRTGRRKGGRMIVIVADGTLDVEGTGVTLCPFDYAEFDPGEPVTLTPKTATSSYTVVEFL